MKFSRIRPIKCIFGKTVKPIDKFAVYTTLTDGLSIEHDMIIFETSELEYGKDMDEKYSEVSNTLLITYRYDKTGNKRYMYSNNVNLILAVAGRTRNSDDEFQQYSLAKTMLSFYSDSLPIETKEAYNGVLLINNATRVLMDYASLSTVDANQGLLLDKQENVTEVELALSLMVSRIVNLLTEEPDNVDFYRKLNKLFIKDKE